MQVKIKRLSENAVIPKYATKGDVGMDINATSKTKDSMGNIVYGTGLAFEIPDEHFMMLVPRSSIAKTDLLLTNSCGIIDSGYRGEVSFKFLAATRINMYQGGHVEYEIGDRIGQAIILPYPTIHFVEVDELSDSERGTGGFGSTGK